MDIQQAKARVGRVFDDGFGRGDLSAVDAALAPTAVDRHAFGPDEPDMAAHLKGAIAMFRSAMPDLEVTIGDLFGEGDRVAARVEMRGTHTGSPLFGVPASGQSVSIEQFHVIELDDEGRGARHWANVGADAVALGHIRRNATMDE
ncbi:MAG: ester cyclase [Rhodococcus sp. (in: high G+C Gram-positive bacteria)]|jgi:predicted ester cyclase|uniref:ester cyclase n=1 Tax=Rhodococcus sp. EPR-157 TaxID=1813677 RepID=UPI0007BB7699|nr:ester cyclase [Rhodococcus sp. EPR-157]KZF11970.1 hypothetical protein A2J03_18895 [Rhodococcus sp. EPR-157]